MAMLGSNQIRKGSVILYYGQPHLVLSHSFIKTARGGSTNRTRLKNLMTGANIPVSYSGNEKAEEVEVSSTNIQFLYADEANGYFMDPESFEQFQVELESIPGGTDYLKEGGKYQGMFYEGKVISLQLPKKISLEVTEASEAVKGDTASNPQKEVTLETGAKLKVPMFIKVGDIVQVNTEEETYTGKDNS